MRMMESASPAPDFGVGSTMALICSRAENSCIVSSDYKDDNSPIQKSQPRKVHLSWVDGLSVQENFCLDCSLSSVGGGGVPVRGGRARSLTRMFQRWK